MTPLRWSSSRRRVFGVLLAASAGRAFANPPAGGRSILVPFSPGGGSDLLVRRVAEGLQEQTTWGVRVLNVPGAGGVVAAQQLLQSAPGDATLLWANSGLICNTPLLVRPKPPFDPATDFVALCIAARAPLLLVASSEFPASSLDGLRRWASRPERDVRYAVSSVGSAPHLAAETLFRRLGMQGRYVTYRLLNQGVLDVADGRVELGVFNWQYVRQLTQSGRLKVLSVLSDVPLPSAPDLPTVASQGYGRFQIQGWFGFFALRAMPESAQEEMERLLLATLARPETQRLAVELGYEPFLLTRREAQGFVRDEIARNHEVMARLGLV